MHRAGAASGHGGKGPIQRLSHLGRVGDLAAGAKRADHRLLVRQFVQKAQPLAQTGAAVHAGNHQHRHRIFAGLRHGGNGIGQPRPGNNQRDTGFTRSAGIAIGHKGAALFVARGDVAHRAAGQPTIHFHGMHAGNAKDHFHPPRRQPLDQTHSDGVHGATPV